MNTIMTKHSMYIRHMALIGITLLISACQTTPTRTGNTGQSIEQAIEQGLEQNQKSAATASTPPPEVSDALLPPINVNIGGLQRAPVEHRFDIDVDGLAAQTFFMSLTKGTPYNMVVHPSVSGNISLSMKNVTVDEVMQTVRNVYGYEYRRSANGYQVLPAEMRSRIFKINYLNVKRAGVSNTRVSSGQVTESSGSSSNGNSDSTEDGQSSAGSNITSGSQVNTASNSDFWSELDFALKAIIGEEEGRKVVINPQSGIIVVRAMPNELREIEEYLNATQGIIQRQVILEAKILEVELNDGYQSGINWAAFLHNQNNKNSITLGQTGGGSIFSGSGLSEISGATGVLDPNAYSGVQGASTSAFGGVFSLAVKTSDFAAFIELMKSQGDVHVLSSPRVSTVNNQKAVIKVGSDEFFVTDINTDTETTTGSSSQSVDVELTPFFSGVALDVIPQVNERGDVTLHIHPSVSEVTEKVKNINITTTSSLSIPLALSTIRESDSIVRARSGQVVVIGGLMQNTKNDDSASVPVLGDLPIMGNLFRHEKQVRRKTELVILLRPVVVDSDQSWNDQLRSSQQLFQQLNSMPPAARR